MIKLLLIFLFSCIHLTLASEVNYRTYQFKELQSKLNYHGDDYFGASEDVVSDLELYASKEDAWYKEINAYLRYYPNTDYEWYSISPLDAKKITSNIDSLYKKVPKLPNDLLLFRGVNLGYRKLKNFKIGEEILEKGYLSTSTSFKVASTFGKTNEVSRQAILILYFSQKSNKGILIDQGEDEVLLPRNLKLKIMKKTKRNSYDMFLVQICSLKCNSKLPTSVGEYVPTEMVNN